MAIESSGTPNILVGAGKGGLDQSSTADYKEGAFRRPQIISDKFPTAIPLWSLQADRLQLGKYLIRQIVAAPTTLVEWLQLTTVPLVGASIKYILWTFWLSIGWYTLIPGIFLVGSLTTLAVAGVQIKEARVSSVFKLLLVLSGVIL